ncbi:MAG: hypothetical protein AB7K24_06950 [Gemmataceae bacterium]
MSVFGMIEDSLAIAGKSNSKYFNGNCDITMGESLEGVLGTKDELYFGNKRELTITGKYLGLGPLLGQMLSSGGFTTILGLSGRSIFTLGRVVNATYGGPLVDIRHGPRIEKSTILPPDWFALSGGPVNPLDAMNEALSKLPGYDPEDEAGANAQIEAVDRMPAMRVLCILLSLTTLGLELALRLGYPTYSSDQSDKEKDPFSTPALLNEALTHVPQELMGILYLYDMVGSMTQLAEYCVSNALQKVELIWEYTQASATWAKNTLVEAAVSFAKAPLWAQVMVVYIIVMLIIVGLVLGGVIT